jgi:hypothetical protein
MEKQILPTCGMRNSRNKLATWIEVTDEAAPTTPLMTFRTLGEFWKVGTYVLLTN